MFEAFGPRVQSRPRGSGYGERIECGITQVFVNVAIFGGSIVQLHTVHTLKSIAIAITQLDRRIHLCSA